MEVFCDDKYKSRIVRKYDKNLFIIECSQDISQNDSIMMITENRIGGLLRVSCSLVNGRSEIEYDISSKQPLSRIFEKNEISYEWLCAIIRGIEKTFRSVYGYMLDENNIILNPEYIYVNVETKEAGFILFPFHEEDVENSFLGIAEYILDKVDHTDEKAVMLGYSLYKGIRNGTVSITRITSLINSGVEKVMPQKSIYENNTNKNDTHENTWVKQNDNAIGINPEDVGAKNNILNDLTGTSEKISRSENKKSFLGILSLGLKKRKNGDGIVIKSLPDSRKKSEIENKEKSSENLINNDYHKNRPYEDDNLVGHSHIKKSVSQDDSIQYGQTVLLSEVNINEQGAKDTHQLIEKDSGQRYVISQLPAVIGKVQDCVDIVIKHPSVSRMHARIYEENNKILINDLESTNGTFVNGLIVGSEESIPLMPGDEIGFGNLVFVWK